MSEVDIYDEFAAKLYPNGVVTVPLDIRKWNDIEPGDKIKLKVIQVYKLSKRKKPDHS
ncbi:MAG: hypothetical protein AAB875_04145 [Patescibacteria group bacterium]